MKKWLLTIALLVSFSASAQDYAEGKHYSKLDTPQPTASPTITEYFSFFCGHCFRFSTTTAPMLKAALPPSITFRQVHTFIPNHVTEELTKVFALSERLGKEKEVEAKIFNSIHVKKQRPKNADDVQKIALSAGISPAAYKQINSFTIKTSVAKQAAEFKKIGVTSIPDLIVNGRYRIHRPSLKSDADLVALIQYLANK